MLLSIVNRGRNDNYGTGSYLDKMRLTFKKHLSNFQKFGLTTDDVEIVFVDWGSQEPLHTIWGVPKTGYIKYIYVPPDITKNFDPPETGFSFVHSVNVAIVRSSGDFIFHCDPDVYITYKNMQTLWSFLTGTPDINKHYYFSRFHINENDYSKLYNIDPTDYEMENIPEYPEPQVSLDNPMIFGGGSAAFMAHRNLYILVGGYDERFVYWGAQDIDLFIRLWNAGFRPEDLYKTIGFKLLHFEHKHNFCEKSNNVHCWTRHPQSIKPNGDSWGLQNLNFETIIW